MRDFFLYISGQNVQLYNKNLYYKQSCVMEISEFSQTVNLPLCKYMDQFSALKTHSNKQKIAFLSGDPTVYGLTQFRMPQKGYDILSKHTKNESNHGYTLSNGIVKAREAILKLYNPKIQIDSSKVFLNHGVNMGLLSVLMAFTNPGDEILVPQMGYPFFEDVCPALKVKAVAYKLKKEKNFEMDLEHAQSLINERTQFIFVINPTNPMGTIFSQNHMQEILNFADRNQLPIVADQVYLRQSFSQYQHKSFGEVTVDVPVIALCGLQKTFSVPGWCTSWTIVFDKHGYMQNILRNIGVICTIFLHTNRMTQQALPELIETLGVFTHDKMHLIEQKHNYAFSKAEKINGIRPLRAQGTIYLPIQIDFSHFNQIKTDKQFVKLFFEEQNVSVLPLSIFGTGLQGMRLITCATEAYYDEFFARLQQFIQKHKK